MKFEKGQVVDLGVVRFKISKYQADKLNDANVFRKDNGSEGLDMYFGRLRVRTAKGVTKMIPVKQIFRAS